MTEPAKDIITLPSGLQVSFLDMVQNAPGPDGTALRFRFLAPAIARDGGTVDFEMAAPDMAHLCQTFALPQLADIDPKPDQIIISLSDIEVPFGEAVPEATQFFEAYRVEGDTCIWEAF